ncbi:MAG: HAD domain-containing protein [Lachnospiraceae bacterium]|nr:HAD domain-containing protein [Lachnospiraceae bacterium]
MRVVFLDIDGVLNGYNKHTYFMMKLADKLHLRRFIQKHYDIFGVRTTKVLILKYILWRTGAKVVLSSSWRGCWYKSWDPKDSRSGALHKKFFRYGIEVVGITPRGWDLGIENASRREEIRDYLDKHKGITEYLILDDERFNFDEGLLSHMVKTSETPEIGGHWSENTGLKLRHIKPAIKILNGEVNTNGNV